MALLQPKKPPATAFLLLFAIAAFINDETDALKLLGLKVPGLVRNGTEESAVLDCVYDLGGSNTDGVAGGLVVKWFIDGEPEPVYQWIPKHPPQGQGRLRGRLDLGYRATNDENTMHRALFIRRPTVELSGKYTCIVSTFAEEKSVSETMVVFVPEKTLVLWKTKPRGDLVRVSCKAEGVYPEPNITLFLLRHQSGANLNHLREREDGTQADSESHEDEVDVRSLLPLEGVIVETRREDTGVFNVEAWADVPDRLLTEGTDQDTPSPVSFHCLLGIPNSEYSRRKSIVYYPGPPTTAPTFTSQSSNDADDGSSATAVSATWFCYFLLFALTATQRLALRS